MIGHYRDMSHQQDLDEAEKAVALREWAVGTWTPLYLVSDRMKL